VGEFVRIWVLLMGGGRGAGRAPGSPSKTLTNSFLPHLHCQKAALYDGVTSLGHDAYTTKFSLSTVSTRK
jgi:hypothetical protein